MPDRQEDLHENYVAEGLSFKEEVINNAEYHRVWIRFEKCPSGVPEWLSWLSI